MQIEVRKPKSGQLVFKDNMSGNVAAIAKGDYRGDGADQIVVCAANGEVSLAQSAICCASMLIFLRHMAVGHTCETVKFGQTSSNCLFAIQIQNGEALLSAVSCLSMLYAPITFLKCV